MPGLSACSGGSQHSQWGEQKTRWVAGGLLPVWPFPRLLLPRGKGRRNDVPVDRGQPGFSKIGWQLGEQPSGGPRDPSNIRELTKELIDYKRKLESMMGVFSIVLLFVVGCPELIV